MNVVINKGFDGKVNEFEYHGLFTITEAIRNTRSIQCFRSSISFLPCTECCISFTF